MVSGICWNLFGAIFPITHQEDVNSELQLKMIYSGIKKEVGYRIHFPANFCNFFHHHFRKCKWTSSFCENQSDSTVTKISEGITEICSTKCVPIFWRESFFWAKINVIWLSKKMIKGMSEICSTNSILFFAKIEGKSFFGRKSKWFYCHQNEWSMARISLHLHWRRGRSKQSTQCWSWWSYQNRQKILTSNSSQSVGGKYHRVAVQSSNYNKLQTWDR